MSDDEEKMEASTEADEDKSASSFTEPREENVTAEQSENEDSPPRSRSGSQLQSTRRVDFVYDITTVAIKLKKIETEFLK